ncbi:fibronectin type III domain-containing protein [Paenibacillus paeoniae]|uniref:Fibronectin type-III domain-containing protein n=1 Tax=Paenibacillus paeoniae TaxID=2292705 RepID=A0A371P7I9_9BACL|nr:chitinase N-terminal domain-containing protein [Paenibacillus paeoniae]REK71892.1 hypothetical protein DX130_19490 [Paenibacillus paeoniae]
MMNIRKNLVALSLALIMSLSLFGAASAEPAVVCEKPGDFTLTATPGNRSMALSWTPSAGVDTYDVYYSPRAPYAAQNIVDTSFTVTELRNGYIGYSFGIIAKNECGSTWSNSIHQVATSATGAPAKPSIELNDNKLHTTGDFVIKWTIWNGNKATSGRLLENGQEISHHYYEEFGNSSEQSTGWNFRRPPGTYTYQVELTNPFGSVLSDPITVIVP